MMIRNLLGLAGVMLAGLLPSCVPAYSQQPQALLIGPIAVGEPVAFFAACTERATAEAFASSMVITGAYRDAQMALVEKVKSGECAALPQVISAPAEELGTARPSYVDADGDIMEARAVRVSGSYWTVSIRVLKEAKRS